MAVIGTQVAATLIAVYGFLMAPLGWTYAGIVWGYALAWLFFNDRIKLAAYKVFGREHSGYFGRHVRKGA
jgi:H+-transporting ATPase